MNLQLAIKINRCHHHHHIALVARISLTLSRYSSLSFIALGRSSGQHPVSSHSCWMYVRAGRPAFARPCVGVHQSTSLMSSSLLLQQCPACLARLTWIVFVIGGRWPYSWCLVGCSRQDLFKNAFFFLIFLFQCTQMLITENHIFDEALKLLSAFWSIFWLFSRENPSHSAPPNHSKILRKNKSKKKNKLKAKTKPKNA